MDAITILKEAINSRKKIEFEYIREDKVRGRRFGNPHALFIHPRTHAVEVHIFQTAGASDGQLENPLPSWRPFIVEFMVNIKILGEVFSPADGYKPSSPFYVDAIAKI